MKKLSFTWRVAALAGAVALLLGGAWFAFDICKIAQADDTVDVQATSQFKLTVKKTGDYSSVTTAKTDRTVYTSGDTVVLKWKGQEIASDYSFRIPVKITYNNGKSTINVGAINKIAELQTANYQYYRRMKQYYTMTTYDSIKSYVEKENLITLPNVTTTQTINVEYARVVPVYRMYNMITSEHLFTKNKTEYDGWVKKCEQDLDNWIGEGIDWLAPYKSSSTKTVTRLYNAGLGSMFRSSHYYTSDANEIASLKKNYGWVEDGEAYNFESGGSTAVFTCYNELLGSAHHYTSSETEWKSLKAHGWDLEESKSIKNGKTVGVFQCVMGSSWSFTGNYYRVNHRLQNSDGSYTTTASEVVQGTANSKTKATSKTYSGYTKPTVAQKTIAADNSTTINIDYKRASYTITYNQGSVSGTVSNMPSKQTNVKYGATVKKPSQTPSTTGTQVFAYWAYDSAGKYEVDWTNMTMTDKNLTLYAVWGAPVTVTFHKAGQKDSSGKELGPTSGQEDVQVKVAKGRTVEQIANPTDDNWVFKGWKSDTTLSTDFDFKNIKITHDTTVYASWNQLYTVSFETYGGTTYATQKVENGKTATKPANDPKIDSDASIKFEGWKTQYYQADFNWYQPITKNTTVYAKWDMPFWFSTSKQTTTDNTTGAKDNPAYKGPYTNIVKTSTQIKEDVEILKKGSSTDNPKYNETRVWYENLLTSDKYHLYTRWLGLTYDSKNTTCEENAFIEARVIQVGEHDGDGSVLTFQTTHALVQTMPMFNKESSASNVEWSTSDLRANMLETSTFSKGYVEK